MTSPQIRERVKSLFRDDNPHGDAVIDQAHVRWLVSEARRYGAIVRLWVDPPYDDDGGGGTITRVQVRSGIPGCGTGWMPVIQAAERMEEFVADEMRADLDRYDDSRTDRIAAAEAREDRRRIAEERLDRGEDLW